MEIHDRSATLSAAPEGVVEELVITRGEADVIRQWYREGMAKKAIARVMGLDIKTVRRAIRDEWKRQRRQRPSSLEPHTDWIRGRGEDVGWNASVLYRELQELGWEGSYPVLSRYVRPLRPRAAEFDPVIRFETVPGRQAQADWGMLKVWIGEERVKVHIFAMILGHSRRSFARAYEHERLGNLLDGFERGFDHFGGRTETILLDNPRTVVLSKDEATGEVEWNRTFKDRMDFYGIEVKLCRYYRPQTKGKVERAVKYIKRNALAGKRFASLDDLNAWLEEWCLTVADERVHGTTHEIPRARFEREERAVMIPIERRPPSVSDRTETRVVAVDGTVVVATNRYPLPYEWIGAEVEVGWSESEVVITHAGRALRYDRITERYRSAQWNGAARLLQPTVRTGEVPPRLDPRYLGAIGQVEIRSLEQYAEVTA